MLDIDEYYTVQQLTELSDPLLVQTWKDILQQMTEQVTTLKQATH